jgi:hypothetical protein
VAGWPCKCSEVLLLCLDHDWLGHGAVCGCESGDSQPTVLHFGAVDPSPCRKWFGVKPKLNQGMRGQAAERRQESEARRQQETEPGAAMASRCVLSKDQKAQLTLLKLVVRAAEGFSPVGAAEGQHQACCLQK